MRRWALVFLFACTTNPPDPIIPPPIQDPPPPPPPPPTLEPKCTAGTRWEPGTPAFRDATADWSLTGVEGTRIAITDLDGDGWADVFVRAGGNDPDDFGPNGVRRSFLLRNTEDKHFEDVTIASNIRATRQDQGTLGRPGEVVAFGDVDNDGDLDVYTGMSTGIDGALWGESSELMLNDGTGVFSLGSEEAEIRRAADVDAVAAATFLDFDRDGHLDLFVAEHNYTPAGGGSIVYLGDHLYRGDGAGNFTEVTEAAGLSTVDWVNIADINAGRAHSRAWSSAACDLDGDGTLEIMVASYGRAPNHLWQGQRDANGATTYLNRSVDSGYAFDGDQNWQDNEFARCFCQANPTDIGCDRVSAPRISCGQLNWNHQYDREPFRLGGNSGTTVCADVTNDGHFDLFTTEITHWWAGESADRSELLVNSGEQMVRFDRPGLTTMGLERGNPSVNWDNGDITASVFDFDNDAWPDIYIGATDYAGNYGLLFHQRDGKFEAVPVAEGIDHHRSHGVVYADLDHDGDLDVLVGHSHARCDASEPANCYATRQVRLFENLLGERGNWIQVALSGGEGSNRSAIGARVTVEAGGIMQTQEVGGGFGHYGIQNDTVLHFGLGTACEATVTVRWPDAALTTESATLVSGYRYEWEQGTSPHPGT
jgi:enediyne biosynthesis protein E4